MQRVKRRQTIFTPNNNNYKLQQEFSINKNIPNGNNNRNMERNIFINNNIIPNRDNKFLSIPEKQKIIDKINNSKNQLIYQPQKKEIKQKKKNNGGINVLYIKKTKSNLNLIDKAQNKSGNINNYNSYNNIGNNHIKFSENKTLVYKTIKEYYKKSDNPFKTYLKSLNTDDNENKTKKFQKSHYTKITNFYSNYNVLKDINNIQKNEIYKKPISTKNVNNNIFSCNKNKYKNEESRSINSKKLYITNSARKEKINCSKLINNNGIKKNIFNIINNYNTKTIKNNNITTNTYELNLKKNKKNNNNAKKYLFKNNTSNSIQNKSNNNNFNESYNKDHLYNKINNLDDINTAFENNSKNKTLKNYKSVNLLQTAYLNEGKNKNNLTINNYNTLNNNKLNKQIIQNRNQKMFYSNNNYNDTNLKYIKKNISPVSSYVPKKKIFKSNYLSNDLPRILVENDLITFINNNNNQNAILENQNNEKMNEKNNNKELLINNTNYNFYSERKNLNNEKKIIEKKINVYINTEVKRNRRNKSLSLSLQPSLNKDQIRNKSFSYTSNKDDETEDNNYFYQNGNNNYKYKNGIYKSKSKNYYYKPNNSLITKEIFFPVGVNKNNSYYYNSEDDIMNSNNSNSNVCTYNNSNNIISGFNYNNNSFDNRNNNILFNNNNYKLYSKSNNNIFTFNQSLSPSPTKDYYFNYLSNKINNDFLNENTFNKYDKNIYTSEFLNKNTFCEKCKRNYCPYCCRLSPEFDIKKNSFINKKIAALKYMNKNYYPSSFHSKTLSMNLDRNNLNNIKRNKDEEDNIQKKIITNNFDLKLDVSNGKHSSENINQNCNSINPLEGSSFNSNKLEINENNINKDKDIKIDLNKNEEIINKENAINQNTENDKKINEINEIKDKEINIENKIKNKKESEIDKNEQIKSISVITSSDRFIIKGEGISCLSNSEFFSNDNTNQKKIKNINLSKDNEEKQNKSYKNMTDIIQNIQVTPTTKRNTFIKDTSINNNDNNFTKTDIDININNTGIIIKTFSIKDELVKKNYINKKNQSESPILSDILECINIISPKNYFIIKNKLLNIIANKEKDIEISFVNILYPIAINQRKYQTLYAKLCKDIDKIDKCHNKKDKTKSIIRTQLMKFCKSNFKKIKVCLEKINYIENDINFIGELINAQMVSKKVGIQCLTHLINKFNQYNSNENLINKKEEKYLYLNCIINLLNQFGTCVNYYQKDKIRKEELLIFQKDINQNIIILNEIVNNKINKDIPNKTKIRLLKLIEKSKNNWELTLFEKARYQLLKPIYEDIDNDNVNINNNNINSINKKFDKNKNQNQDNTIKLNKQSKSMSPNNNKNMEANKKNQILNKTKKLSGYSKIIEDNLILFKNHINEYGSSDTFKDWEEIDNLFLNKKIKKSEIFLNIINATKYFIDNKNDLYYFDIYIKIILEYYKTYLYKGDINDITNALLEELSHLACEEINKEENKYINDIWIVIIYYLLESKIISMNDFNYFSEGYNNEIKNNIFTILNGVCNYNIDNKKLYLKELTNTKFINMNKNVLSINIEK